MFTGPFYFGLIRKYVILTGTLFNQIRINRYSSSNILISSLRVPIMYGPKDKMLARVFQDPLIERPTAVIPLPVITFELGDMYYDGKRKLPTINKVVTKDSDPSKFKYQYNPTPYNIRFRVFIYAKNAEDGNKIIEQILPYFTPDWTTTVELVPELGINMDVPITLDSITYEDDYANGKLADRRSIVWTLNLTLKGYFYGPVRKSGIIKFVKVNFLIPEANDGEIAKVVGTTPVIERLTVQPGLTANGEPTTNIDLTVPYSDIEVDDDYDFITRILNTEQIND